MPFCVDVQTQKTTSSLPMEKCISVGMKRGRPIYLNELLLCSLLESDVVQIIVQGAVIGKQDGWESRPATGFFFFFFHSSCFLKHSLLTMLPFLALFSFFFFEVYRQLQRTNWCVPTINCSDFFFFLTILPSLPPSTVHEHEYPASVADWLE